MSPLKLLAVLNLQNVMRAAVTRKQRECSTNTPYIAVTLDVSHAEMSPLNAVADWNLSTTVSDEPRRDECGPHTHVEEGVDA